MERQQSITSLMPQRILTRTLFEESNQTFQFGKKKIFTRNNELLATKNKIQRGQKEQPSYIILKKEKNNN